MSKELADKLEQLADDLHSQAMIDADEVLIMRESIAALRSEPVAEIELSGGMLGVNFTDIDWKLKATDGTKLYAAPSRETDQRENSNPAPMHGQSKTGLTGSHPGAPTHQRSEAVVTTAESRDSCKQSLFAPEQQSFDHPTAEPALSAEHIEQIRRAYDGSKVMDSLCRMALSSLTARDEVEKMRRRVEMYRDKARGNHEAYLKLYADFVGIEGGQP